MKFWETKYLIERSGRVAFVDATDPSQGFVGNDCRRKLLQNSYSWVWNLGFKTRANNKLFFVYLNILSTTNTHVKFFITTHYNGVMKLFITTHHNGIIMNLFIITHHNGVIMKLFITMHHNGVTMKLFITTHHNWVICEELSKITSERSSQFSANSCTSLLHEPSSFPLQYMTINYR
jgi:hypothetical protein